MPSGWQLKVVLPYISEVKINSLSSKERTLRGGDYIRLKHLQTKGNLLSRLDDSKESASVVAPLGLLARKAMRPNENTHTLYIQTQSNTNMSEDERSASATTVWQITLDSGYGFGMILHGSCIRIRNVLSGLYLCVRNIETGDDVGALLKSSVQGSLGDASSLVLATTSIKDRSSLFSILSFDSGGRTHANNSLLGKHAKSILFSDSISFVHCDSKFAFEPLSEIGFDNMLPVKLVQSSPSILCRESYKAELVPTDDIMDILFLKRFFNIASKAISYIQSNELDNVYLPLYRHWHVSLYTLAIWIQKSSFEPDATLYKIEKGDGNGIKFENNHVFF